MAHILDSVGRLFNGLGTAPGSPTTSDTRPTLAPMYGPEETVPGLACSYGARAYAFSDPSRMRPPSRFICHNPVEAPDERHHCDQCGGDHCATHAEPVAHDCAYVITGD